MKIAHVVAQRVETPKSGYAMRTWAISAALAQVGDLVVVNVGPDPAGSVEPGTIEVGTGRIARYERVVTADLPGWFAAQDLDVVVAAETALVPWIRGAVGATRIVNCHNVESELSHAHARRGPTERRAEHTRRARSFELLERSVFSQLDQVWVATQPDADALAARVPGLAATVVPNVVPVFEPVDRVPEPGHGVFFGSLWYEPNQDAVTELLTVSEELDRRGLAHRFTVAGAGAPPWLAGEIDRRAAVTAPGFVVDLAALIDRASCAVFPMTYGGGSMVKLLEALGAGCPVITTPDGARGIPELVDGANVVIRQLGQPFLDAVADLIVDPHRFDELGRAGARLVRDRYSVGVLDARVAELLRADPLPPDAAVSMSPGPDAG